MGQAKNRGAFEDRVNQAKEKMESLKPATIECVHCKAEVGDLIDLEPPASAGIDAAFSALCLKCGLLNYKIIGPENKVREVYRKLAFDKLDRYKARRPDPIACDSCKSMLNDVTELPTEGMPGITSAHAASCLACEKPTYVIKGQPKAVSEVKQKLTAAGFLR